MGKMKLPFIDSDLLYIEVSFNAGLNVYDKGVAFCESVLLIKEGLLYIWSTNVSVPKIIPFELKLAWFICNRIHST